MFRTVRREVTEPVVVITRPHVHVHDADLSRRERDVLVLTAEERRWGRRRVITQAGRTLALALPTGSTLTPGDILHVTADWHVVVGAAAEPVLAGPPPPPPAPPPPPSHPAPHPLPPPLPSHTPPPP